MLIPSRKAWQDLRDANHVPKGAAKVSIGDDIKDVHESYSLAKVAKHKTDVVKLIADLTTYVTTVKKKYPAFEAIVNSKVKKKADDHLKIINDIIAAKTRYPGDYAQAVTVWNGVKNATQTTKALAVKVQQMKGCVDAFALIDDDWEKKRGKVQSLFTLCDGTATLSNDQKHAVEKILAEVQP